MSARDVTVKKSPKELQDELAAQIELLVCHCEAYDQGRQAMVRPISAVLKILLYGDRGRSLALLHQLKIRDSRFVDTALPLLDGEKFPRCELAAIHVAADASRASYVPTLSSIGGVVHKTPFHEWWTAPVVRDAIGRKFSRMSLVQEVRDTDGGAHVDQEQNELYADFKSGKYMGWKLQRSSGDNGFVTAPHLACIRQIAHETLLTLQKIASEQFTFEYKYPQDPTANMPPGITLFRVSVDVQGAAEAPIIGLGAGALIGVAARDLPAAP